MDDTASGDSPIAVGLAKIARRYDLSAFLTSVTTDQKVDGTKAIAHCHHIALDGSGLPRLQDFTDEIATWVLDYVIPRKKLFEASSSTDHERRIKEGRLRNQAIESFKSTAMSGEQGEMLLFVLAEALLGLPQLLCKMDLKTDPEMHFHGLDGVHCGPGSQPDKLAIYWCESKVYADFGNALGQALDGLKPFLVAPGTGDKDKRRELSLLDRYMDIGDEALQRIILNSLDPSSPAFNKVEWRGLCLVGFDHEYPSEPNSEAAKHFTESIASEFATWVSSLMTRTKNRGIETFEIHVIFVPFGFCENFRSCMTKSLGVMAAT